MLKGRKHSSYLFLYWYLNFFVYVDNLSKYFLYFELLQRTVTIPFLSFIPIMGLLILLRIVLLRSLAIITSRRFVVLYSILDPVPLLETDKTLSTSKNIKWTLLIGLTFK